MHTRQIRSQPCVRLGCRTKHAENRHLEAALPAWCPVVPHGPTLHIEEATVIVVFSEQSGCQAALQLRSQDTRQNAWGPE